MTSKIIGGICLLAASITYGSSVSLMTPATPVHASGRPYATCKEHPDAIGCRTKRVTTSGGGASSNHGTSSTSGTSTTGGSAGGGQSASAGNQSVVTGVSYGNSAAGSPGVASLPSTGGGSPSGSTNGMLGLVGSALIALGLFFRRLLR